MEIQDCIDFCTEQWNAGGPALEGLKDFIRVPNLSPGYDPAFHTNGLIHKCIDTVKGWIESQGIRGLTSTVFAEKNKEPLLMIEIEGTSESLPVMFYGHLDKMPHLDPKLWDEGLSATNPIARDGRLYGRGSNDDGYAGFCAITAIKYLQQKGLAHPKIVILLETGEESGEEEIMNYLDMLRPRLGKLGQIVVLDAEAEDYNTVWCCTSLRGVVMGTLKIQHLSAACHSGMATGLVPSTFRIARMLLSRIEDQETGDILIKEANLPEIPKNRIEQNHQIAAQLGEACLEVVQPLEGCKMLDENIGNLLVNKAWKPGLAVTGADGIPSIEEGSNVIRPYTNLKLSLRIPPGVDSHKVGAAMKEILEKDPPYGAKVSFDVTDFGEGYTAADYHGSTASGIETACKAVFNQAPLYYGEGGSIPLCNKFQELWPEAQVLVTGAAGVDSCPHGPNESIDLNYLPKFTAFVSYFTNLVAN